MSVGLKATGHGSKGTSPMAGKGGDAAESIKSHP